MTWKRGCGIVQVTSEPELDQTIMAHTLLSNRGEATPVSGVGVDTISFAGPTSPAMIQQLTEQHVRRSVDLVTGEMVDKAVSGWTALSVGLGRAHVRGYYTEGNARVKIESSLPTMLFGHNRESLALADLEEGMAELLGAVQGRLPDLPQMHECKFTRLDLARDFHGVSNCAATLGAIQLHPVPYARPDRLYLDTQGGIATLMRGSPNEYVVRGYDKSAELAHRARSAPRGSDRRTYLSELAASCREQLRFEAQLKSRWLRRKELRTMGDLRAVDLVALTRHLFEATHFGAETGGGDDVGSAFSRYQDAGASDADLRNLSTYLFARTHDMDPALSRHPLSRARAAARRYGLEGARNRGHEPSRRLDFDSGTEVVGPTYGPPVLSVEPHRSQDHPRLVPSRDADVA